MYGRATEGKCIVCGGEIFQMIVSEFDPMTGPLIIGPGSKHQFREASAGFHCTRCGIKYLFIPPAREKLKEIQEKAG